MDIELDNSWMQTYKKKRFYVSNPKPEDIDIEDIAHSLALQCRFNGFSNEFYSVAQHSVLMAAEAPKDQQLAALLHDASEAYLCDIPRPIKPYLTGYKDIEDGLMQKIAQKFKFNWPMSKEIKLLDERLLVTEARDLLDTNAFEEWAIQPDIKPLFFEIIPWGWQQAENVFLQYFHSITKGSL